MVLFSELLTDSFFFYHFLTTVEQQLSIVHRTLLSTEVCYRKFVQLHYALAMHRNLFVGLMADVLQSAKPKGPMSA